jgi:hypothetical protein
LIPIIRKPFFLLSTTCSNIPMFWCHSDFLYAAIQMSSFQDADMSSDSDTSKLFEDTSFVASVLNSVRFIFKLMTYIYSSTSTFRSLITTGAGPFPECQKHSGKTPKHSGKPSPSATLGEGQPGLPWVPNMEHSGKPFPSAFLPLGEVLTPSTGFFLLFPECNTRGRNFFFFLKPLPRVPVHLTLGEGRVFFFNLPFPECQVPRHSKKAPVFF